MMPALFYVIVVLFVTVVLITLTAAALGLGGKRPGMPVKLMVVLGSGEEAAY
jgi:hypothetical protein